MDEWLKPLPAVVYFDPKMTEVICYGAWKFALDSNIYIRQIPMCIYEEFMESKRGVFLKLEPAFQRKMENVYAIILLLPTAYVLPGERNVFTRVCRSIHPYICLSTTRGGGGPPG